MVEKKWGVKIRIAPETREALKRRGTKGESYDDVIRRLLKETEE